MVTHETFLLVIKPSGPFAIKCEYIIILLSVERTTTNEFKFNFEIEIEFKFRERNHNVNEDRFHHRKLMRFMRLVWCE
jgi:hypothetical protein